MSNPIETILEDAIWYALESEQGTPHSGVDMTAVVAEFRRRLRDGGVAVTQLPEGETR